MKLHFVLDIEYYFVEYFEGLFCRDIEYILYHEIYKVLNTVLVKYQTFLKFDSHKEHIWLVASFMLHLFLQIMIIDHEV